MRQHRIKKVVDLEKLAGQREQRQREITEFLNKQKDVLEKKKSKLYQDKEHAVAHLEASIKKIEQPYDKKINELDHKIDSIESKIFDAEFKLKHAVELVHGRHAVATGEIATADALKGVLLSNKVHVHNVDMIKEPLKNGIVIFRHYEGFQPSDSSWVSYFAVYDGKIVGFHFTRKSEHAGDTADYWSWIGQKKLRDDNRLAVRRPHPWIPDKMEMASPTFKGWKSSLEKRRPASLPAIDLKDVRNQKILASSWQVSLGED